MSGFEANTFTAPSHWASYLINGDASGMKDSEIAECDEWLDWVGMGAPVDCKDAGFIHYHSAYRFTHGAADCQEYTFLVESRRCTCSALELTTRTPARGCPDHWRFI